MRYLITTTATVVHGTQTWLVEADSPEEALRAYERGEREFASEELEVQDSTQPTLADVELIDEKEQK